MGTTENVLVSLHRGYGLGDAVQVSAVLRHVAAAHPDWIIDYQAEEGYHCVGRGLVANTFAYGDKYPHDFYHREVQICLFDEWRGYTDRPNTHVTRTLKDTFGLDWDPALGRYNVPVSAKAAFEAGCLVGSFLKKLDRRAPLVAIHYQGRTARHNKDLSHAQGTAVCGAVEDAGAIPLLLDWEGESPLTREGMFPSVGNVSVVGAQDLIRSWGRDAEMTCAVIQQCRAFVGVDSGPAKCASATDVPSLVVWTKHSPEKFHDPAPNTTHLVPESLELGQWFSMNYNYQRYAIDPIPYVEQWLREVLR